MRDADTPQVVAYRVTQVETKVDAILVKIDELRDLVTANACPQPGACVPLTDSIKRLEKLVERHEEEVQTLRLNYENAKTAIRVAGLFIVGASTTMATVASLIVQFLAGSIR